MTSKRDYSFEALAEATSTDMVQGRGQLNAALKSIREQTPEMTDYALADEIHTRARLYRDVMGDDVILTAPALAKHWRRVFEESKRPRNEGSNRNSGERECEVCNGDRFVVVNKRRPAQTQWMVERGIEPADGVFYEEMAACPSCNPTDTSFWRYDGSKAQALDEGRVREYMVR